MKRLPPPRRIAQLLIVGVAAATGVVKAEERACQYDLAPIGGGIEQIRVAVRCNPSMDISGFQARASTEFWHMDGTSFEGGEGRFVLDLGRMARALRNFREATPYGDGFLVAPEFLLPLPRIEADVSLRFRFSDAETTMDVITALRPALDGRFELSNRRIDDAGPILLGTRLTANGLDGDPQLRLVVPKDGLGLPPDKLNHWVSATSQSNRRFWGKSPVRGGLVVIVPAPGRNGIPFGRVMSEGGAVITILVGDNTDGQALYEDWVLVHELLHLGSPVMRDTGTWLNEGIATFYEPVLRARAGWKSEADVWREWISQMPRGMRAIADIGLSNAGRGGIYWGGAIFVLMAEIEALRASRGNLGFSDCLRQALSGGGDTTQRWSTEKLVGICDSMLGGDQLSQLLAAHVAKGSPVDLPEIWKRLGVILAPDSEIAYDDNADLAWMRDLIIWGGNVKPEPISSAGFFQRE